MRISAAVLTLLVAQSAAAASNFSGSWSLDPARSTGLPRGVEQSVVVDQSGMTLRVTTTLISDNSDRVVRDVYDLSGTETDFDPQLPGLTPKLAKRTARSTGERTFEAKDHIEGENASGPVTLEIERTWQLSADGRTLTVDQAVTNSGFTTRSLRVLTQASPAASTAITSRLFPIDMVVPVPPTVFRAGGKTNLVYELHVTSFRLGDVDWKRLEIRGDDDRPLASFNDDGLQALLVRPATPGAKNLRQIPGGARDVAFIWLTLDGPPPSHLYHRATFGIVASANGSERIVDGATVRVHPQPIVIAPPVRGGNWIARWISPTSFHRRALFVVDGGAHISQRFAIDWNRIGPDMHEWHGEGKKNDDYTIYGQDVIAVADSVVARVVDAIPENEPGALNPKVTVTAETATGNSISLRLPDGNYAVYAHLQPGSIRVSEGQRVRRGEVLARIGNSGNAVGPHLHFHVATGPMIEGEGLPYVFDAFEIVGHEEGQPKDDGTFNGTIGAADTRRNEMPAEHMLVRFR